MTRYLPLFRVDLLHDYFLSRGRAVFEAQSEADRNALTEDYSVGSYLEIFPDQPTLERLAGHKMIFRTTGTGFIVAVQTDLSAIDRPAVSPAADFSLTFVLRIKDTRFANYTELGPVSDGLYRFGNDTNNAVAGVRHLSQPVRAFDASRRYVAGETYAQTAGAGFDLFRAIRDTGPSIAPAPVDWERIPQDTWNPATVYARGAVVLSANRLFRALVDSPGTDLGNAAEWQPAGTLANQYANAVDAVLPASGSLNLDLRGAGLSQVTIRLFRPGEASAAAEWTVATAEGLLEDVQISLRGLSPGLYRLEVLDINLAIVPGRSLAIYITSAAAKANGWFGTIDIGLGAGDFALFNPDGTLRSPLYTLRFLNRATRWRYIFPAPQSVGTGAEVAPEAGDNRILVTAVPRPLTRFGTGARLQADVAGTPTISEEVLLPEPEINRIRRQNAQWFSEIHLSNLPLGL
ncbi:MAG: hypothetical protein U1E83_05920 [Methylotetracoccus sp.]